MSDPTRPDGTPVPSQKSWLPVIAGAFSFFIISGCIAWWMYHRDEAPTQTEPVAEATSSDEDNDPATMTEAKEQEAAPEPPTPAPVTPSAALVVASLAPAAAPTADPTNCAFVNGNRPQVMDKYVLTCTEGAFLANGEYKGGGVFTFSDFTPHTPTSPTNTPSLPNPPVDDK